MIGKMFKQLAKRPLAAGILLVGALTVIAALSFAIYAYLEYRANQQLNLHAMKTFGEPQRDWLDLRAQQNMAEFALGMLWVAGFTLLVSVVGVVVGGASVFLLLRTWQATTAMTNETARMAEDTRRMANHAETEALETRKLLHAQMRAYVRAKDAKLINRGDGWHVKITLKNDGETPALMVYMRAHVLVRQENPPRDSDTVYGTEPTYMSKRPIPPKEDDSPTYPVDIRTAAATANTTGRVASIKGDVIYRDTFGQWLRTEFEFYVQPGHSAAVGRGEGSDYLLSWGRRGAGGVYDMIAEDTLPEFVKIGRDPRGP